MVSERFPAGAVGLLPLLVIPISMALLFPAGSCLALPEAETGAEPEGQILMPVESPAWLDRDNDGTHDLFRDLEGDGLNDLTNTAYAHRFGWQDLDRDGLNDLFRDADGDGVNDLEVVFRDRDDDGINDNVLDFDRDGRNDVTGLAYDRDDLHGERYGFIVDGAQATVWVDEDGDGFPDPPAGAYKSRVEDSFIDRDGDGMADDCWFQDEGFRRQGLQGGGVVPPGMPPVVEGPSGGPGSQDDHALSAGGGER